MTRYHDSDNSTASQEAARQERLATRAAEEKAAAERAAQRKADKASGAKIVRPSRWRPGRG